MEKKLDINNMNGITEEEDKTCGLNDMNCLEGEEDKTCGLNDMNCVEEEEDKTCGLNELSGRVTGRTESRGLQEGRADWYESVRRSKWRPLLYVV